MDFDEVF